MRYSRLLLAAPLLVVALGCGAITEMVAGADNEEPAPLAEDNTETVVAPAEPTAPPPTATPEPQQTGMNPFAEISAEQAELYPLPDPVPDAPSAEIPLEGTWSGINMEGQVTCGEDGMQFPLQPSEDRGTLEVLDDGERLRLVDIFEPVAEDVQQEGFESIFVADPEVIGLYTYTLTLPDESLDFSIDFYMQVVSEDFMIGYLDGSFVNGEMECRAYRPYEVTFISE